ncbi:hypothetical protein PAAG_06227 [Paracoccidioides lutzii Pb01]|uniref:PH domain-containing protein n=1 Tax=Paracoccidioides lutzii (strain ATCC MYA-826 / Pb01) TaxID=502779 RepID=C1H5N2_PARBA|nr:hypothetical protein PAAG_06227 [Paracoccidioides lutzii Pb01]EEH35180.2 hypothetical protein PAAG_06227 [Paracoccidioides lutzii Pb01]
MDSSREHSVLGSRRGLSIRPIYTHIGGSNVRPKRPPRPDDEPDRETSGDKSLLKSESSKTSLKSLFSRNKTNRRANHEQTLPAIAESQRIMDASIIPDTISSTSPSTILHTPKSSAPLSSSSLGKPGPNKAQKSSKFLKEKNQKISKTTTSWDPPPLFQAYPQAIKQGTLSAPTVSAESILRITSHRRNNPIKDGFSDIDADDERIASTSSKKRKDEKGRKHSRRSSGSNNKFEWTQKIFILVTSGYLLQYPGEGNFDRLPDKMMELGKNSVAFASDAIPGKHWVLQISQTLDEDGSVTLDTKKTFLSRFGFTDSRRQTKSLLLVCDSPEEMTSWLAAVRREIEALGGKEYVPETPLEPPNGSFQHPQTHRQSVMPDKIPSVPIPMANREFTKSSPTISAPIIPEEPKEENKLLDNKAADETSRRSTNRLSTCRQSIEAPSSSTTGTITDLDRLREGSRLSYVSNGTRTIPSSRASSPGRSPARPSGVVPNPGFAESPSSIRSTLTDSGSKLLTAHTYPAIQSDGSGSDNNGSRFPPIVGPLNTATASPPNFSVPVFSKRFSASSHSATHLSSRKFQHQVSPPPSPHLIRPNSRNHLSCLDDIVAAPQLANGHAELNKSCKETDISQHPVPFIFDPNVPSRTAPSQKSREIRSRRYSSFESSSRSTYSLASDYRPKLSPVTNESSEDGHKSDALPQHNGAQAFSKNFNHMSAAANTETKQLRRPTSMQIGSEARRRSSSVNAPQTGTQKEFSSPEIRFFSSSFNDSSYRQGRAQLAHPEVIWDTNPPANHNHNHNHIPTSSFRNSLHRSTSHLSLGPPVAPPPDCPLPKVPLKVPSQFSHAWKNDQSPLLAPGRREVVGYRDRSRSRSRSRTRTGPDESKKAQTTPILPVDLRDAENSSHLSGMTPKEYSMVNAF